MSNVRYVRLSDSPVVAKRAGLTRRGSSRKQLLVAMAMLSLSGCDSPVAPRIHEVATQEAVNAWAIEAASIIDQHRATLGCAPLRWHHPGAGVAESYARQMSEEGFFGHVDPAGVTLRQRLNRAGISGYRLAAETIAAGQDNPPKVVRDWLESPEHRAIVEDCRYTEVGLGFHLGDGPYREYWTAVFFEPN